jgi:hypothetical protein
LRQLLPLTVDVQDWGVQVCGGMRSMVVHV